jgi:hypothetical protein
LGLADGPSVAKLLEATLLQPVGLLKALEAFPIAPAFSGFPSSGDVAWVKDMPTWAKLRTRHTITKGGPKGGVLNHRYSISANGRGDKMFAAACISG